MVCTILLFQVYEVKLAQDMDSQVPEIDNVEKKKKLKGTGLYSEFRMSIDSSGRQRIFPGYH